MTQSLNRLTDRHHAIAMARSSWMTSHIHMGDNVVATMDLSPAELSMTVLIHPKMWDANDQRQANQEGWIIADMSGGPGTCKIIAKDWGPYAASFTSDLQATEFVMERVYQGSAFHTRAWLAMTKCYLHGIGSVEDEYDV